MRSPDQADAEWSPLPSASWPLPGSQSLSLGSWLSVALRLVAFVVAGLLARYALQRDVGTLKRSATDGTPVPAARRGVLIMNLKSGGGKAERFHLADECRSRQIEPVVLQPGRRPPDARPRRHRRRRRRHRHGGRRRLAGLGGECRRRAGCPHGGSAGRNEEPPRPRSRDRPGRRGRGPRRLRRGGGAPDRPQRGQRPGVRQQRVAWTVRHDRPVAGIPRRQGRDGAVRACRRCSDRIPSRSTCSSYGPDGEHHDGAHVIQVSNGPYGKTMATMGSRPRVDAGSSGW